MAMENGNNVFNYVGKTFLLYRNDNMIFVKALQIVQMFQTRSDFPYCIDEMDKLLKDICGINTKMLAYGVGYPLTNPNANWNPEEYEIEITGKSNSMLVEGLSSNEKSMLVEKFQKEIRAFQSVLSPIIEYHYTGMVSAGSLKQIAIRERNSSKIKIIRFIRNDNQFLDLELDKETLQRMVEQFQRILGK